MILDFFATSKKNVMTDFYIDTIGSVNNKENHIVILPNALKSEKLKDEYAKILIEKISSGNIFRRLINMIKLNIDLFNLCKNYNITKVYFCDEVIFNIAILPIILYYKLDIFIWVHDPKNHSGERLKKIIGRKVIDKLIIKKAKMIFVTYEKAIDEIIEKYNVEIKRVKSICLPEVKNMQFPELKSEKIDEIYDYIFYGRIEEYKGIDILLRAIKYINDNYYMKFKILIIGTGSKSKNVIDLINKYDLKENISFINEYVSDYDLAKYICLSKYVILPYKDATGTQTVQVANYYNKPVIVNSVGAFNEYVKHNVNGIIIEDMNFKKLGENLWELSNNNDIKNTFNDTVEKFFEEKFSINKFIESLEKYIK